jgi:hypothetical protein
VDLEQSLRTILAYIVRLKRGGNDMVKRNPIRSMHWLNKIKQILQYFYIQIGLFIVLIPLCVACTSQPQSDYYLEPIVSESHGTTYARIFLSVDKRALFYIRHSETTVYALNLKSMQVEQPKTLQNCLFAIFITDDVIVCEHYSENSLDPPELHLVEYPSFNFLPLNQSTQEIDPQGEPIYVWGVSVAHKGFIKKQGVWHLIDLDLSSIKETQIVNVGYPVQSKTPIYSPDGRYYYIFFQNKLSVYTTDDNTLQWEQKTRDIDRVSGWMYNSCGLIYYYNPLWEPLDKVYPIYQLHVPCDSNQTPTP